MAAVLKASLFYSSGGSRKRTNKKITAERLLKLSHSDDGQGNILFTLSGGVNENEKEALMSVRKLMRGTRQDRPVYALQLVQPVIDGDSFHGLLLLVGTASEQLNAEHLDAKCAYIAYVHAVELHNGSSWSGSELAGLGVAISRLLGMDRVRIHDGASITCSGKPAAHDAEGSIMLSDVMVLARGVTLYSRLGFRPVPDEWDSCTQDSSSYAERVSRAFRIVETVTVGELREYCKKLSKVMTAAGKLSNNNVRYLLVRAISGCGPAVAAAAKQTTTTTTEFRWHVDPAAAKRYYDKSLKPRLASILKLTAKIPNEMSVCDCLAQTARSPDCADLLNPLMVLFEPVDASMMKRNSTYNWRFNQVHVHQQGKEEGLIVVQLRGMDAFYDLLASRVVAYEMPLS